MMFSSSMTLVLLFPIVIYQSIYRKFKKSLPSIFKMYYVIINVYLLFIKCITVTHFGVVIKNWQKLEKWIEKRIKRWPNK